MNQNMTDDDTDTVMPQLTDDEALRQKLIDAMTPGFVVEFDPGEAERAGAFVEDALTEEEAADSMMDLNEATQDQG
jgi:hypothetical protein